MQKIFQRFLIIFFVSPFFITSKAEQWDKNITTKVDVESFWNQLKEIREKKYGVDKDWDKNMDYCSYFAEKIAISKGEGYIMSNLIRYTHKCLNTLGLMTKYVLEKE